MVLAAVMCSRVYAGDINANEASVIAAAKGQFEYNGKIYVAKAEYIHLLESKFSADGIDLTGEQAQQAVAAINKNVAQGVSAGYLIEMDRGGQQDETEDITSENTQADITADTNIPQDITQNAETSPDTTTAAESENTQSSSGMAETIEETIEATPEISSGQPKETGESRKDLSNIPTVNKTSNKKLLLSAIVFTAAVFMIVIFCKRK